MARHDPVQMARDMRLGVAGPRPHRLQRRLGALPEADDHGVAIALHGGDRAEHARGPLLTQALEQALQAAGVAGGETRFVAKGGGGGSDGPVASISTSNVPASTSVQRCSR